CQQHSSRPWTF
nr:immunoglobulin light chain junction region [Macaca mulatta]MOX48225.1 immunoglobulin light chain junction region [Macaca mulatta]MOX49571.1 immunoglobulin light chain junction region [Macaca mulatta]MOX50770.1 immunoglobulin light chain junction region [Macaca mulatta]